MVGERVHQSGRSERRGASGSLSIIGRVRSIPTRLARDSRRVHCPTDHNQQLGHWSNYRDPAVSVCRPPRLAP